MASDPTPIEPTSDETPAGNLAGDPLALPEAAPPMTSETATSVADAAGASASDAIARFAAQESAPAAPITTEEDASVIAAASAASAAAAVSAAASASRAPSSIETELADEVALAKEVQTDAALLQADADAPLKQGLGVRLAGSMQANPVRTGVIIGTIVLLIAGFFIPVPEPHVALGGEAINSQVPWWFTNSLLTTLIVDVVLLLLAFGVFFSQKMVPGGLQNFVEMIIEYFWGLSEQIAGKAAKSYFPWIMTIFLFVILANWTGLIPGVGSMGWNQVHEEEHAGTQQYLADHVSGQLAMADGKLVLLTPDKVAAGFFQDPAPTEEHAADEHATDEKQSPIASDETVTAERRRALYPALPRPLRRPECDLRPGNHRHGAGADLRLPGAGLFVPAKVLYAAWCRLYEGHQRLRWHSGTDFGTLPHCELRLSSLWQCLRRRDCACYHGLPGCLCTARSLLHS